uniref:Uncharacterized protein n=1 Tax=viral metagenome TaxID=1070528 RepID=A0A6M3LF95_9ZZZZ
MPKSDEMKEVYEICTYCRGTKERLLPLGYIPCEYCNATGIKLVGYVEK